MSELLNVTPQERIEIAKPAADILAVARDFKIVTAQGYESAAEKLMLVKGAMKALDLKKKSVMGPLNAAVAAARALFAEPEDRLKLAESMFKGAMLSFQEAQERERAEAQRVLDEAARKEREKAEAEARAAAKRADDQRRAEEEARRAGNEAEARRLAALATANEAKVEEKTAVAQTVVPAIAVVEPTKVSGIAMRETWSALVLDPNALVKAIAAGTVPMQAFEPNMKFLNNQAKALKKDLAYPGVRAVRETGIAAGSR